MHGQFTFVIIGLLSGVVGWVYSARLTDADMILNRWFVFCDQYLWKWIAKPIVTCYKCVCGQAGLWAYVIFDWHDTPHCVCTISISILTSLILNRYVGDGEQK